VGKIKHSLTYSGGLSRSYARTYAPAHHFGFQGFSPNTRPSVIAIAEAIPFVQLTDYSVDKLYELKGEIVARGIASVTGMKNAGLSEAALSARPIPEEELRRSLPFRKPSTAGNSCLCISEDFLGLQYPTDPASKRNGILDETATDGTRSRKRTHFRGRGVSATGEGCPRRNHLF